MQINRYLKQVTSSDSGVTLIELLAALAILSVVVTAFLAFFIQAAHTNSRTDEVNEATFIAQEIMEELTYYSSDNKNAREASQLINDTIERTQSTSGYAADVKITSLEESALYKVTVTVKGGTENAQMETRLPFKEVSED